MNYTVSEMQRLIEDMVDEIGPETIANRAITGERVIVMVYSTTDASRIDELCSQWLDAIQGYANKVLAYKPEGDEVVDIADKPKLTLYWRSKPTIERQDAYEFVAEHWQVRARLLISYQPRLSKADPDFRPYMIGERADGDA